MGGVPIAFAQGKAKPDSGGEVFQSTNVWRIQIEISPAGIAALRNTHWGNGQKRPTVRATIREGENVYHNVAVHLKGAAGSFRPIDRNPAFTLNFDKFMSNQSFHGLQKFSLNNSVQDRSFLSEQISRELFEAAGVPVPRAAHAKVALNGRDLGLYVLTEGFNKQFLKRYFKNTKGNLYDGGFIRDITDGLGINSGDYPNDHSGLKALAAAAFEPDPTKRMARLEQALDVDRFLSFLAMEVLLVHWDGYAMNRNNWRVFHDLDSKRMVFMPHGLDQTFGAPGGRASGSIMPGMQGLVARAVMNTSEGRRRYLERLSQLATNVFKVDSILQRVDELSARIRPAIAETGIDAGHRHDINVDRLKGRISQRIENLSHQLGAVVSVPRIEAGQAVRLSGWRPRTTLGAPGFPQPSVPDGGSLLNITAPGVSSIGSWRTRMLLEQGRYQFRGRIRTKDVRPIPGEDGTGAELRISQGAQPPGLMGTSDWREFVYQFSVRDAATEVEFVCELKASGGEAWFDTGSLRLLRLP
ncbi:MAG: CotH kinase family protein [Verrucomicrobia bacterium]|nr:CotH kinase family protein [Verrucomicrobiota bacterium]